MIRIHQIINFVISNLILRLFRQYPYFNHVISGQNYTIAVDIGNLPDNSTCDSVALLSENGSVVSHLNVTGFKIENIWRFLAPVNNIRNSASLDHELDENSVT